MIRQTVTIGALASLLAASGGTQALGPSQANSSAAKDPCTAGTKT